MNVIHSFQSNSRDLDLLRRAEAARGEEITTADLRDYDQVIVKKPWGYEYLAFDNGQVAIWILHIARKRKTSMHCHPQKTTGLMVLSGSVACHSVDTTVELATLGAVEIDKGTFHSTEAASASPIFPPSEDGSWLMEIEAPSNKVDLVRTADAYGRQGQAYEGGNNIVPYDGEWLQFVLPDKVGETTVNRFLGLQFSFRRGHYPSNPEKSERDCTIAILGYHGEPGSCNPRLQPGRLLSNTELRQKLGEINVADYLFLSVGAEEQVMKLSDYVASFIAHLGVREVFSVSGGGAMHLVDSVGKHAKLSYIATHHEQAAAMAAEAYARISRSIGVALVTTGPGGTNAITGVVGAWIDSIPTLFISGQVTSDTLSRGTGLRQFGVQECDIVELVKPITKYAVIVTDENEIRFEMEKAAWIAMSGRPGPVWVDLPLDIQSKQIDPTQLRGFVPPQTANALKVKALDGQASMTLDLVKQAQRPVLIYGYGVRLSRAEEQFVALVRRLAIPVVSSWTASDIIPTEDPNYVGRLGIFGDRAANFAVQNADLLLIMGSRMSIPQVGYNYSTFAREARIIMVDIDPNEIRKASLHVDLGVEANVADFIDVLLPKVAESGETGIPTDWQTRCHDWKQRYPVVLPDYENLETGINSFYFIDQLSKSLDETAVVVTDMGTSFTCTMQAFAIKKGQRLTTSSGHASMGFGLPGAIGACYANNKKRTICISGEGGLQMNIQELQTMVHNKLPITLFVINNGGYLTIKHMQQNHFGRYVGADPSSGVSCPDILKLAQAYGIPARRIENQKDLVAQLPEVLAQDGPYICEIMMPEDQPLIPRSSSLKRPDGQITSKPLEDLFPFLDRAEFMENMIVRPTEILE